MIQKMSLQTNIHCRIPLPVLSYQNMTGLGHLWSWACVPALEENVQASEGLLEQLRVEDGRLGTKASPTWL